MVMAGDSDTRSKGNKKRARVLNRKVREKIFFILSMLYFNSINPRKSNRFAVAFLGENSPASRVIWVILGAALAQRVMATRQGLGVINYEPPTGFHRKVTAMPPPFLYFFR
jgi:hypothetical protein